MSAEHDTQPDVAPDSAPPAKRDAVIAERAASAAILRGAMDDCGMSGCRLAVLLGVHKKAVQEWVNGVSAPSMAMVLRMPVSLRKRIAARIDEQADSQLYRRPPTLKPHRHATIATMSLGEYADVVLRAEADGVVDAGEHRELAKVARKVESVMRTAAQDHERAT